MNLITQYGLRGLVLGLGLGLGLGSAAAFSRDSGGDIVSEVPKNSSFKSN